LSGSSRPREGVEEKPLPPKAGRAGGATSPRGALSPPSGATRGAFLLDAAAPPSLAAGGTGGAALDDARSMESAGDADAVPALPSQLDFSKIFNARSLYSGSGSSFVPPPHLSTSEQLLRHFRARGSDRTVVILIGPPASGKSTLAAELHAKLGKRALVTSDAAAMGRALAAAARPSLAIVDLCGNSVKARKPFLAAAEVAGWHVTVVLFDFDRDVLAAHLAERNARNAAEDAAKGIVAAAPPKGKKKQRSRYANADDDTCRYVPPSAQLSILNNVTAVVNDELARVNVAYVVHAGEGVGEVVVSEVCDGGVLALSESYVGRGYANLAAAHARALGGEDTEPVWNGGPVTTRNFDVDDRSTRAQLAKLREASGLRVMTLDERGSQRLFDVLLEHGRTEITVSGERLSDHDVMPVLRAGGMTHLAALLAALKGEGILRTLFVAFYVLGCLFSFHKDAAFKDKKQIVVQGARAAIKLADPGGSSSVYMSCPSRAEIAAVTFASSRGHGFLYSGAQEVMTNSHAVGPSTNKTGANATLLVDVLGDERACIAVEKRIADAIALDGVGWERGGAGAARLPTLSGEPSKSYSFDQRSKGGSADKIDPVTGKTTRQKKGDGGASTHERPRRARPCAQCCSRARRFAERFAERHAIARRAAPTERLRGFAEAAARPRCACGGTALRGHLTPTLTHAPPPPANLSASPSSGGKGGACAARALPPPAARCSPPWPTRAAGRWTIAGARWGRAVH
jgi:predicted kinase